MKRRDKFDHILVETTGMADPGPVAQTFFMDDDMKELFALDGIVTLVDAKHVHLHVNDSSECREQIAFADVLVLNKADLVTASELDALERRVRAMNSMAKVLRSTNAEVAIPEVLDVGGFDLDRAVASKPTFLVPEYPFEWAGTYELEEGAYDLTLDDGPDPNIVVVFFELGSGQLAHDRSAADQALRAWAHEAVPIAPSGEIAPSASSPSLLSLAAAGRKSFRLRAPRTGRYALYTQHLPAEFSLALRKNGAAAQPIAGEEYAAGHTHDAEVGSVGIHLEGAVDGDRLNKWLSTLLREKGADIFRMKGILNIEGNDSRFVFQGVHMLLDGRADRPWGSERRASDLVFIGRNLDRDALTRGFEQCLA